MPQNNIQNTLETSTLQNNELFPYLEMGTGFVIGLSIGYVLKKSFKLLLFLTGIALIGVFVLESQGVIAINEQQLENSVSGGIETFKHMAFFLKERLEQLEVSSGISAIAGFFVGLKIG